MALQFRSNAAVGDPELVIAFDLDGLAALMRAIEAALATGQGHLTPEPDGPPNTFRRVTVRFDSGRDDRFVEPPDEPPEARRSEPVLSA